MANKSFSLKIFDKIGEFKKTIEVDSDKSISIRSFLIGSISQNISKVKNVLESDDVLATIKCLEKLGVTIKKIKTKEYEITGKGLGSLFCKKGTVLNFQNSGTLCRLLTGILSTTPGIDVVITGDSSLKKRNMSKLIGLMNEFGAEFFPKNKFYLPLRMVSSEIPIGIKYKSGVSAQLKSAVALAATNSFGVTTIIEEKQSRNHTENMLLNSPSVIKINKKIIKISGKNYLNPLNINVSSDPSAAAFYVALTLLNKKSYLKIKNVGLNKTRIGFYELLKKHGAKIIFKNIKKKNNEIIGDIDVASSLIKPLRAPEIFYVKSTDEFPILFCIAALTNGISIFKGIGDLVNKESNRITEMKKVLKQIGIKSIATKNQIKIFGNSDIKCTNKIIKIPNLGDHRICMSATILALITGAKAYIENFETVNTSSPNFLNIIKSLGGKFEKN
ncbi:MAG: 3-phosphoshikimate 1-carboxyvinyltransferase [Pelagibacterales bacterium]|nr:3-phosphoshikimate 1-carboxyvinyltransferase [Pelagibacterales bacterium]